MTRNSISGVFTAALVLAAVAAILALRRPAPPSAVQNPPGPIPAATITGLTAPAETPLRAPEIVAEGLNIPWEIAFLHDGSLIVTERPGRLLKIGANRTVIPIQGVQHIGEGGLLGMALHPNFVSTQWLYLYLTTRTEQGLINRVERYRLISDQLTERTVIIDNIPGAQLHDGGRLSFGPDGFLYISTGDAGNSDNAQNKNSLAGKILRLRDDGSIPPDNPFQTAVYTFGHRNVQGLAWDEQGRLWATEHGRSGIRSGLDEINLIVPGGNYGWPIIQGDETRPDLAAPVVHSGPDITWAPAGAAIVQNRLFFAGLRGESLYEAVLDGEAVKRITPHLAGEYGRLRAVVFGPDGWLYVTTSNTDGRGRSRPGDDKIIKLDPQSLL